MARGHSNVILESYRGGVKPYPTNPDRASVPIQGGAYVWSVKELPPLSLDREEWEAIGVAMGWMKAKRTKKPTA